MDAIGVSGRIAGAFIRSKLTPLLIAASIALGIMAVLATPREEEPQITVPMIDVVVGWPGATAEEVERLVTVPLERAIREIAEVEYVYAISRPSGSLLIARFYVNSDPERALVNVRAKAEIAAAAFPPGVLPAGIIPRSIDDVPILALTFSSERYGPLELRRVASEIEEEVRSVPDVAATTLLGGLRREIRVEIDADALASRGLSPAQVVGALQQAGVSLPAGSLASRGEETVVETGEFLRSSAEIEAIVVAAPAGRPVHLRDVARVMDGPEEPESYVFHAPRGGPPRPAVTLAVAKTRGANATAVAERVLERVGAVRGRLLPAEVEMTVTRNYGETAAEKSNELIEHLIIATISVVVLMALALGWRESIVVGVAVPVTLALTLLIYYLMGYTLNRVTLFALIFSIGILVDDAIVVVENIYRHFVMNRRPPEQAALAAVDEVGNPTILATFTVIAAILPMAFVTGLMGPYMRPIPVGASFAMVISLVVAFTVSPWLSFRLLAGAGAHGAAGRKGAAEGFTGRIYRAMMAPLLGSPRRRWAVLGGVLALLLVSVALVPLKWVQVKMLPFDNKSEVQIVVDAPEGTPLESTLAAASDMAALLGREPVVRDVQVYAGTSAPFNFNGLVRHYFLRSGANVADVQVNLLAKHDRYESSHDVARRFRPLVQEVAARHGVRVKVTEVPPGPPVLSTLVAEIYGEDPSRRREIAERVLGIFEGTAGVEDADWFVESDQPRARFVVDREKAALAGVDPAQAAMTLRLAVDGVSPAVAHPAGEREPVPVNVRLARSERSNLGRLGNVWLASATGAVVPISEIARLDRTPAAPFLYRKNGRGVTYVVGEVAGVEESPVYAILNMSQAIRAIPAAGSGNGKGSGGYGGADGTGDVGSSSGSSGDEGGLGALLVDDESMGNAEYLVWDGEWRITYEVFRDLGIAFGAVLILIYVLVVAWFRSFLTPLLIMAPIPLTLVGILPGHAAGGVFFTATSMIGMIALAGVIVRNSILLVDFIELSIERGMGLREAVLEAGAVRFRPIALTAAAVIVGALVIILDPIFQGLAVALIAGVFASTALTLVVIPLLYFMAHRRTVPAGS